jgi:Ca-activated chloride channel family protein
MSVTAQDVLVRIQCEPGIRPIRVLGRDAEIAGGLVTVSINQLYDAEEQSVLLELEVPGGRAGAKRQLAGVRWSYDFMAGGRGSGVKPVEAIYIADEKRADESKDTEVMVAVVEQIANEKNQLAVELRDEGRIEEAQQVLIANTAYARGMAAELDSPALDIVADENEADAETIVQKEKWTTQRKMMRESQLKRSQQRGKPEKQ